MQKPCAFDVRGTGLLFKGGLWIAMFLSQLVQAGILYVAADSQQPTAPFQSWETAAANIQDAISHAHPGDIVLVTNGTYRTGLVEYFGTNRIALTNAITVRSLNGAAVTRILGGTNGVRCAYVGAGAVLSGFTLTQGRAPRLGGGGVLAETGGLISDCELIENSADDSGGGAQGGLFRRCRFTRNRAQLGGGGASLATLVNCVVEGNQTSRAGGGTRRCYNLGCVIVDNRSLGNLIPSDPSIGGGTMESTNLQCTIVGNVSGYQGGGVYSGQAINSIVYKNRSHMGDNFFATAFRYSCTTPLPPGNGNIEADPELASSYALSPASPCIAAGVSGFSFGLSSIPDNFPDLDGEGFSSPPAMGADQPNPVSVRTLTATGISLSFPEVGVNFPVRLIATAQGPIRRGLWDFGDGTTLTNQAVATHEWSQPGVYTIRYLGIADDGSPVIAGETNISVLLATAYVDIASTNPTPPYGTWDTATTNIQEAILTSKLPGRTVLVRSGVYTVNRTSLAQTTYVTLTNAVVVRSVDGPEATILDGLNQVRVAYVGNDSLLDGFTLRNGFLRFPGSGVQYNTLLYAGAGALQDPFGKISRCLVEGSSSGASGGGVSGGTVEFSRLRNNAARGWGGGVQQAALRDCEVEGNTASDYGGGAESCFIERSYLHANNSRFGGGVSKCRLYDSRVEGNIASAGSGAADSSVIVRCRLIRNSANTAGAVFDSSLYGCLLVGNNADLFGGAAFRSSLFSCTVTRNEAGQTAGGLLECESANSIVYFNSAPTSPNYSNSVFAFSCSLPIPAGDSNTASEPSFVDPDSDDFRLRSDSPCLGTGDPSLLGACRDLLGTRSRRLAEGKFVVDIGAFAFAPSFPPSRLSLNRDPSRPGMLTLTWDSAPPDTRLQRTSRLSDQEWEVIPVADGVLKMDISTRGEIGFFRLVHP